MRAMRAGHCRFNPLAPSISFAAVKTGREAVDSMERIKRVKCAESCEKSNVAFMPIVLSTFGVLGADGAQFCNQLASGMRCCTGDDDAVPNKRQLVSQQLQKISRACHVLGFT